VCTTHCGADFYVQALHTAAVAASHLEEPNLCDCDWCESKQFDKFIKMVKSVSSVSAAVLCDKVEMIAAQPANGLSAATDAYVHYKPACVQGACADCSNCVKIPECHHIHLSGKRISWRVFGTLVVNGVKAENQVIEKQGSVSELWKEFTDFFYTKYTPHNSKAKQQDAMQRMCLATYSPDTTVWDADFSEKFSHESNVAVTCNQTVKSTLMIAIVHHSPRLDPEAKKRVHDTTAYIVLSDDPAHDADFHRYATGLIYKDLVEQVPGMKRIVMWTDGCAKQYKGKRCQAFVSRTHEDFDNPDITQEHNSNATAHGKGMLLICYTSLLVSFILIYNASTCPCAIYTTLNPIDRSS
jgi:hypothetical protein